MAMLERLRKLYSLQDPTGEWQRGAVLRLEAELGQPTFNGVELGRPLSELSDLGPVEIRDPDCREEFGYPSLGLIIESLDDGTFTGFQLVHVDHASRPAFSPFGGECRLGEQRISLAGMTETRWTAELGECYWRDEDEDEVILFYEFPYHEWQVEFTRAGALKCIIVTGSPLMADEAQRKAYRVTRPWPPASVRD